MNSVDFVLNKRKWNALSAEQKAIVTATAAAVRKMSSTTSATGQILQSLHRPARAGRTLIAGLAAMLLSFAPGSLQGESLQPAFCVLVFSKTAGFRHDSIPAGIAAIQMLGEQNNYCVETTENAGAFADESLARFRVVIFLNTSGNVLDPGEQAAFERFVRRGGGFVGIHAALDTEHDWPWYGALVGTYFRNHPAIQAATLNVVDPSHQSTRLLPINWTRTDEWYNYTHDLDPDVTVLIRIDERSYRGGTMGANHPISWYHLYDGGRAWCTAIGHTSASYAEPRFLQHLLGGIEWAAGVMPQ
jgi:type 1 glutamine amidotransferase